MILRSCAILLFALTLRAQAPLRVAAAADLRGALDEVITQFRAKGGSPVEPTYGASGALTAQITQGAPFGLFLSADLDYPATLRTQGLVSGDVFPYATGHVAFWVVKASGLDAAKGLGVLKDPRIRKVALANPKLAPYGRAAEAALRQAGLLPALEAKLVFGENVAQTAQFALTGNVEATLISATQARNPGLVSSGTVWILPEGSHPPLRQGGVILAKADPTAAAAFRDFLLGPEGQALLAKHGFGKP